MNGKGRKTGKKKAHIPTKPASEAIRDIERSLGNGSVLIYIQDLAIGTWDVIPIFSQLSHLGKVSNLNLILDSIASYPDDAYKIANVMHEFCDSLTVIIPFKAKSAATLLSLAGQTIVMGPLSELGPLGSPNTVISLHVVGVIIHGPIHEHPCAP